MKFWRRKREEKLYKQWVKHNGLPLEAIPKGEVAQVGKMGGEERDRLRPYKERLLAIIRKLLKV